MFACFQLDIYYLFCYLKTIQIWMSSVLILMVVFSQQFMGIIESVIVAITYIFRMSTLSLYIKNPYLRQST